MHRSWWWGWFKELLSQVISSLQKNFLFWLLLKPQCVTVSTFTKSLLAGRSWGIAAGLWDQRRIVDKHRGRLGLAIEAMSFIYALENWLESTMLAIALHITDSNVYINNFQLGLYLVANILLWIGHDSVMAASSSARKRNMYRFFNPPLSLVVHVLHRVNHRKLVENNRANILGGFKFRTVKQLSASQPDPVAVDKEPKRAAATVPNDSSSIGKEHKRSGNTRNWLNYGKRCGRWSKASNFSRFRSNSLSLCQEGSSWDSSEVCELLWNGPRCLFHVKERESLCSMFKWVVPWWFFCCSTHLKMNKTASLSRVGDISSFDVIRRPMVDFIAAITCSAVGHRSITACRACLVLRIGCHDYFLLFLH